MFNINENKIIKLCGYNAYYKGFEYFRSDRVKSVQYNKDRYTFNAVVQGAKLYDIKLAFTSEGNIINSTCTCPSYSPYHTFCKHIAALLLFIKERDDKGFFKSIEAKKAAKELLGFFSPSSSLLKEKIKADIRLEILLGEGRKGKVQRPCLVIRIGSSKLYIVKNLKNFLENTLKGKETELGKNFSFNPLYHDFQDEFKPVAELLFEMHENEKLFDNYSGGYGRSSVFNGSRVYMTESGLKRFLMLMSDKTFEANLHGHEFISEKIINENIPVNFILSGVTDSIMLKVKLEGTIFPITEDGEFFFHDNKIYRISDKQKKTFLPFYTTMIYQRSNNIVFEKEDIARLFSDIIPNAEKSGIVKIDGNLADMVVKEPLLPEFYIDYENKSIKGELKLIYGNYYINPFEKNAGTHVAMVASDATSALVTDIGDDWQEKQASAGASSGAIADTSSGAIAGKTESVGLAPAVDEASAEAGGFFGKAAIAGASSVAIAGASSGVTADASSVAIAGASSGVTADASSGAIADASSAAIADTSSGAIADTSSGAIADTSSGAIAGKTESVGLAPAIDEASAEAGALIENRYIIRDIDREQLIMDNLSRSNFKVKEGYVHLDGDDEILDFISDTVPELNKYCNVFYSESIKNIFRKRKFKFTFRASMGILNDSMELLFDLDEEEKAELSGIIEALRFKKKYYRLRNGSFISFENSDAGKLVEIIDHLGIDESLIKEGKAMLPAYRALYLDRLFKDGKGDLKRNDRFKEYVRNITEPEDMDFEVPSSLDNIMRDYQKTGLKWLKTLSGYGLGGILADDMGLGKTLQVISFVKSEKEKNGRKVSIVVVPSSLVYNWKAEVEKFAPDLSVRIVSGLKGKRESEMALLEEADLVITSYPLIRRDIENYGQYEFRFCILDEAQHIKNPDSVNARSVKKLKAEKRFALSGTPIENSILELWSIFDFIIPGYLYTKTRFLEKFDVSEEDRAVLQSLSYMTAPFILRRLKKDVLKELPDKIEQPLYADMEPEQQKLYLAHLNEIKKKVDKEINESGFDKSRILILACLTRLRQLCCHPSLFVSNFNGKSGKMLLLQEITLDAIEGGHRILLFSQFTSMLELIKNWLDDMNIEYMYLDGNTPVEERGLMVSQFNEGKGKIFLISLKAGGTGLNLTGADMVIHYDPWWNPAVEDQATDRAYRIGQNKAVQVIKLITRNSIEEKIQKLQERKKALVDAIIKPGETLFSRLDKEDIMNLFSD